jgi:hypothetical protein
MSENRWGEGGLTIVLLPSGELGTELLEVAKQWTEMKLLTQALWVRPEFLESGTKNPPKQKALVLGEDRDGKPLEVEVDLFEQLARQQLFIVRLLVVRSASDLVAFDSDQDALGDVLEKYLTHALPLPVATDYDRDKYTQFLRLNLVTAPTEFEPDFGSQLVGNKFNGNFVAAAEDRSAPLAGDAFMRHEPGSKRFAAFTMMHAASIGALWTGLPVGLFELLNPDGSTGSQLRVPRVFISAILTDGLARRASSRVLRKMADPMGGAVNFATELPVEGTYQISDSDRDSYINEMVRLTMGFDDKKLSYRPSPEAERVRALKIEMGAQTSNFFKFSGDKLISIPRHMARWFHAKTARLLNVVLHGGDDTGYASVKSPTEYVDPADANIMANRASIATEKERADIALRSPVTPSEVRSTPELWRGIRDIVFGMLDGSNLGRFGFAQSENGWPIFYRVSDLFADPATQIRINPDDSESMNLSWSRPTEALNMMKNLSIDTTRLEREMEGMLRQVVEGSAQIDSANARIAEIENHLESLSEESEAVS